MDKQRMELILPAQRNTVKSYKKADPPLFLSDLLHVNPIVDKRNSKNKLNPGQQANNFTRPSIKFENKKQENYQRLNRETKLKQNKEYTELLKNSNSDCSVPVKIEKTQNLKYLKKLQETNNQIDEATVQLEQISAFIEAKKNQMKNKYGDSTLNIPKLKTKSSSTNTNSNLKHACTKNIYPDKVKDINSMMKYIDKHITEPKKELPREKNNLQRKKLNDTIGLVNTKLNKVKDKYFNNDYETTHINNIINKKSKYKSVKDLMKKDTNRLSTMEASKIIQADLENDINNLSESSDFITVKPNNHMEVLYKNVDLIQKESFQDNFSDELRVKTVNLDKISPFSIRLMDEVPKKYLNTTLRLKTPEENVKKHTKNMSVDTQTMIPDNIERSIMKSDYLMKEFGYGNTNYFTPNNNNMKIDQAVKNVTRKWTKDLQSFMT